MALEVELIWGHKLNSTVLLFHLNRWTVLVWIVANTVDEFMPLGVLPVSNVHCNVTIIDWFGVCRGMIIVRQYLIVLKAVCLPYSSCIGLYDFTALVELSLFTFWAGKTSARKHSIEVDIPPKRSQQSGYTPSAAAAGCLLSLLPLSAWYPSGRILCVSYHRPG